MESGECDGLLCSAFKVQPSRVIVKFNPDGGKCEKKEFVLTNISRKKQKVNVDLTAAKHFQIVPNPCGSLISGKTIHFVAILNNKGLKQKIYNETIRISCPFKCSINLSLTAVPRVRIFPSIPRTINFGQVPLGHTRIRTIRLRPLKTDVPYVLMTRGWPQDLSVMPYRGLLKSGTPPLNITITYRPTAYATLSAQIALHLPTLSLEPFNFSITASTVPRSLNEETTNKTMEVKKVPATSNDKVFTHPSWLLKPLKFVVPKTIKPVWSQHSSNKILFSHMKDKRSIYELLGPLGAYLDEESQKSNGLENEFLGKVTLAHRENFLAHSHTRNKLRGIDWSVMDREELWKDYLKLYETQTKHNEAAPLFVRQRTIKRANVDTQMHTFTGKLPNIWFPRYVTMAKFIEAGRRIIHKNRLIKVLKQLKLLKVEDVAKYENPPVDPF